MAWYSIFKRRHLWNFCIHLKWKDKLHVIPVLFSLFNSWFSEIERYSDLVCRNFSQKNLMCWFDVDHVEKSLHDYCNLCDLPIIIDDNSLLTSTYHHLWVQVKHKSRTMVDYYSGNIFSLLYPTCVISPLCWCSA